MDATLQCTAQHTGATAVAKSDMTGVQNGAGDVSIFVAAAAAAASASWMGWFRVKCLWTPVPLCSRVPVEEGTA